jgi:FtsP/CotA-like multicopper oxidase with cupredoxin domain
MKKLIVLLLVGFSVFVFSQDHQHQDHQEQTSAKYTFPMHPEVISDQSLKRNSENGKVSFGGKTVRYDLYVKDTLVNFTGKEVRAIAVNGKLQAPTLYFTEGDTAEIYLHNQLKEKTGFHWHGVMLPNDQDGVPYLTTKPVMPGETHLYKFKISQNGTY